MIMTANQALQRTRPSRCDCNPHSIGRADTALSFIKSHTD